MRANTAIEKAATGCQTVAAMQSKLTNYPANRSAAQFARTAVRHEDKALDAVRELLSRFLGGGIGNAAAMDLTAVWRAYGVLRRCAEG